MQLAFRNVVLRHCDCSVLFDADVCLATGNDHQNMPWETSRSLMGAFVKLIALLYLYCILRPNRIRKRPPTARLANTNY